MIKNFQNIVVLGAGKSGIGAAVLAKKNNLNVLLCDDSNISKESTNTLREYGVEYCQLDYMSFISTIQDVLVVSPGVENDHQLVKYFLKSSKPIISEIEFASYFCNAKKICVTGTNGKTTTTLMVSYLLENAGYNVKAVGNIGQSYAMSVALENMDYYVIEPVSYTHLTLPTKA